MPLFAATAYLLVAAVACCAVLLPLPLAAAQEHSQITNVKDLEAAIYTEAAFAPKGSADACVRLLHARGAAGCATPGRGPAEGRLQRLDALLPSADDYPDETAFVLQPALLPGFLQQAAASPALAARVRGVLVEPTPAPAPGYSQDAQAPLAEFALYAQQDYAWNPTGAGLLGLDLPFPVLLLDEAAAASARQRAAYNADQNFIGALNWARMALRMDGAGNSSACLAAQTCLPLGGHSVLATLPPLPPPAARASSAAAATATAAPDAGDGLPTVWVLSQFDTASLFHEAMAGADAPVSGLIAMLAAAEVLGHPNATAALAAAGQRYRRRLVFAALGGEPWGLMGSKRLLWELSGGAGGGNGSAPLLPGLSVANGSVAGVLEVTQVGRTRLPDGTLQLWAHTPAPGGAPAGPHADLVAALRAAAANTSEVRVAVSAPDAAVPGLPPTASAGSFARVGGPALPAALLAGFDTAFQGGTYHTQYDTLDGIDTEAVAAAAVVLARAAHALALGGPDAAAAAPLPVAWAEVRATVGALSQCLLNSTVGLACPLAQAVMTPVRGGRVSAYIGILRTLTADPQAADPAAKSDVERFIWNFLAFATVPMVVNVSAPDGGGGLQRCQALNATACPLGFVCAASRAHGSDPAGFCLNTTAAYAPAYSTALLCDGCDGAATQAEFRWKLTDAAAAWDRQYGWPPDPVWTESNWPLGTPALTLFLREAPGTEWALLGAGLAVTAASVAGALWVQWAHQRKLKRQ